MNRRLVASFRYAFAGLGYLWRTQPNVRIHGTITLAVVALGMWLGLPSHDWAVIVVTVSLVLVSEALNTAVEATVDLVSPQPHPLAKVAKDVGAGAVVLSACAAVVVGLLLLGPPLWTRLFGGG
jgi:diacylglycerol kinase